MKTISFHDINNTTINVPVIDHIPAGYVVWNIGKHAPAGYVLLCKCNGYNVIMETLQALPVNDHDKQILDAAASYGYSNLQKTRRAAAAVAHGYKNAPRRRFNLILAALTVFEKISD